MTVYRIDSFLDASEFLGCQIDETFLENEMSSGLFYLLTHKANFCMHLNGFSHHPRLKFSADRRKDILRTVVGDDFAVSLVL